MPRIFKNAPSEVLKDMVCRMQIKRKTQFTSTFYGPQSLDCTLLCMVNYFVSKKIQALLTFLDDDLSAVVTLSFLYHTLPKYLYLVTILFSCFFLSKQLTLLSETYYYHFGLTHTKHIIIGVITLLNKISGSYCEPKRNERNTLSSTHFSKTCRREHFYNCQSRCVRWVRHNSPDSSHCG